MFTPNIKKKKHYKSDNVIIPFPNIEKDFDQNLEGTFNGFTVEIQRDDIICSIYQNGCFGSGSISHRYPKILKTQQEENKNTLQESLILDLEEAFFLSHTMKVLKVNNMQNQIMSSLDLLEKFINIKNNFIYTFIAYQYLKSKNWIVKSGLQFGGDFLIYKQNPGFYHASFLVIVTRGETFRTKHIQSAQRVSETSGKDLLMLEIYDPPIQCNHSNFLNIIDQFKISEVIIKRFDFQKACKS